MPEFGLHPQGFMSTGPAGAPRLSLVVPMYNEEAVIDRFLDQVLPILRDIGFDYEIVCVNDGSSDRTLELLERARAREPAIKVIDLTRNFGKEAALSAGLDFAIGDAVVPLDADLQDPPELIHEMVEKWQQGFDMVVAIRRDRRSDPWSKRGPAEAFYAILRRVADVPIPANAGDFRLMDRRVVEALKLLPERTRFMKGIFAWLGFHQTRIYYTRPGRPAGSSKWNFIKLWNFALEGIFSFTTLPLRIWTYFGLAVASAALTYMLVVIVRTAVYGDSLPGYPSLIIILLFFSGINMLGLGIIGEYLGRVFIEVKRRPLYLVRGTIGFEPDGRATSPGRRPIADHARTPPPGLGIG